MERLGELLELFDETAELLYAEGLEPSSATNFSDRVFQVQQLVESYEDKLLPLCLELNPQLEPEVRAAISERAAHLGLGVFAVVQASGDSGRALMLLGKVGDIARSTGANDLALAAGRDTASFLEFARIRHRLANGHTTARAELKKLAKGARESAIAAEARETFHAPQPLKSAPTLWTINGFGTGLYGSRERRSDGSEIKTLCLAALFIPLFPISAYRVVDHGDGAFSFTSKNRLSGFARAYQKLLAVSIIALIGWCNVNSYLNSPGRLAAKQLDAAVALERDGKAAEAALAFDAVIDEYAFTGNEGTIEAAGLGVMRLSIATVPDPFELKDIDQALRVVKRFEGLRGPARRGKVATLVIDQIKAWQEALGSETEAAIAGAVSLLEAGTEIADPSQQDALAERARELKTALAERLTESRPLAALELLIGLDAREPAGALLAKIATRPSLMVAASAQADRWLAGGGAQADTIRAGLALARKQAADPDRLAALASRDPKALSKMARTFPNDHELVAGLAELDLGAGQPTRAVERLEALGKPGWLIPAAQELLAAAHANAGDVERADSILTDLLAYRLPTFRKVASAYYGAAKRLRESLMNQVDSGTAPAHVMTAIRGIDEKAAIEAFETWSSEQMSSNPELGRLKAAYEDYVDVVGASLRLGMLKLRRANQLSGDARESMLSAAEAVFLSIRDDAEGVPSYHLGLGQVYHRLGKSDQGDAELGGLVARKDPQLSLQVSSAYRELGQVAKAKEVAEGVYNAELGLETGRKDRESAAHMISFIVDDLDDKQMWLERSNAKNPEVQTSLLQVRARRAARDGDDKQAEKLFRRVAAFYARDAKHNAVSANNAAIAYIQLYDTTGNRKALAQARAGFESSLRLAPQDALVVSNLTGHCNFEGWLDVLSKWLPVDQVRLDRGDIQSIRTALAAGPEREALLARAAAHRIVRRAVELGEQERILAPAYLGGWERELARLNMLRDAPAMAQLAAQMARVKLDATERQKRRAEWLSGEADADFAEGLAREQARLEARLADAKKAKSKPAIAAYHFLLARNFASRGALDRKPETLRKSVDHHRQVPELWPALATGGYRADSLVRLALLQNAEEPAIAAALETHWRRLGLASLLAVALSGKDADAFRSALAKSPLVAEARRALADARPSLLMWTVGNLLGDDALTARGAEAFDSAERRADADVEVLLNPGADSERIRAALLAGRGTLKAEE